MNQSQNYGNIGMNADKLRKPRRSKFD